MSERIPAPGDLDKTNWNDDGATYPPATPNAAKRLTGYKPLNVPVPGAGEIITAGEQNWLHGLAMQLWTWLKQFVPREWGDIAEGLDAATTVRDLFRVVPPLVAMKSRLDEAYSVEGTAASGGFPTFLCTDGEQIYYIAGAGNVSLIAADPRDGSEIWESGALTQFLAVCADGLFVYASGAGANPGLRKINRTDGTAAGNVGTGDSFRLVRANGFFAAMIAPTGLLGVLNLYTVATPAFEANATPTTSLNGLAMDADQCYVGGTRNTKDVWAYKMGVGTLNATWDVTLDANEPTVNSIVADGDYVYVATDSFAVAAGGNRDLFCLDRVTGALIWSMDLGADVDFLATDGVYLYAADSAEDLHMIKLSGGPGEVRSPQSNVASHIACDGISVFCSDGATAANFRRLWTGGPTRTFMRAAPADTSRRPFHHLAVPIDGRT